MPRVPENPAPPHLLQALDNALAARKRLPADAISHTIDWLESVITYNTEDEIAFSVDELHLIFVAMQSGYTVSVGLAKKLTEITGGDLSKLGEIKP